MAELRQSFQEFIFSTNTDGSGKAASYVRTLAAALAKSAAKSKGKGRAK